MCVWSMHGVCCCWVYEDETPKYGQKKREMVNACWCSGGLLSQNQSLDGFYLEDLGPVVSALLHDNRGLERRHPSLIENNHHRVRLSCSCHQRRQGKG